VGNHCQARRQSPGTRGVMNAPFLTTAFRETEDPAGPGFVVALRRGNTQNQSVEANSNE
jgi:hypothetical protein